MAPNPHKCFFMLFGVKDKLNTGFKKAKKKKYWRLLLIANLIFPRTLIALPKGRIQSSMLLPDYKCIWLQNKRPSSFITSEFNYCHVIWIFCSKKALHRLNNIHKRSPSFIHQDSDLDLLEPSLATKIISLKDGGF